VLTTVYFVGVLLKTESIDPLEQRDFGFALVSLVALVFASFCALVVYEVLAAPVPPLHHQWPHYSLSPRYPLPCSCRCALHPPG
jgi:hypothetical protein